MKVVSGAFGVGSLVRYAGLVNQFVRRVVLLICEVSKMIMNNDYMQDTFEYLDMPKSMPYGASRASRAGSASTVKLS